MTKKSFFIAFGLLILLGIAGFPDFLSAKTPNKGLIVPYIKEVPAGTSGGSWKNACEEASMAMVEKYYSGKKVMNVSEGKIFMVMLFDKQKALYNSDANSDAARTVKLINDYSSYNAVVKNDPTIEDVKNQLNQRRPVISLHNGFVLNNKNIPFLPSGSGYHMMVITGYDDPARQFIVNDPGDTVDGQAYRYGYDVIMESLHDYSAVTKKAGGPARVIFTYPKLARPLGSPKIYYLHGNIRQYVTNPAAFKDHGWKMEAVNTVSVAWFNTFKEGESIRK